MKKITLLLVATIIAITFNSCKKSDDKYTCSTCKTTPDALAANDASSKGIYKGVLIGSTGTIKFDVLNDGTDIVAEMVIDGTTVNLTSSITWVSGQPFVAPFTGTLNGSPVSITFSVSAIGTSPVITSATVPGHPYIEFTLVKETSVALIEGFIGKYHTTLPEDGTFNIVLSRTLGKWGGISREDGTSNNDDIDGTIDASGHLLKDGVTVGTLSGDEIHGSFVDGNGKTVTIDGERKL